MRYQEQPQPWTPRSEEKRTKGLIARAPAPCRRALTEFSRWLAYERGLSPSSITLRLHSASRFLEAHLELSQTHDAIPLRQPPSFKSKHADTNE